MVTFDHNCVNATGKWNGACLKKEFWNFLISDCIERSGSIAEKGQMCVAPHIKERHEEGAFQNLMGSQ